GTAMALWTHHAHASTGVTNAISKGGDFGGLFGLGLAFALLDAESETYPPPDHSRAYAGSALLGSGIGIAAGYQYAKRRDLTWGDSEVLRSTLMIGAYTAYVPLVLGEVDSERGAVGALMAGGAVGLAVGDYLLRDRNYSAGQGIVQELSPIAGGL